MTLQTAAVKVCFGLLWPASQSPALFSMDCADAQTVALKGIPFVDSPQNMATAKLFVPSRINGQLDRSNPGMEVDPHNNLHLTPDLI